MQLTACGGWGKWAREAVKKNSTVSKPRERSDSQRPDPPFSHTSWSGQGWNERLIRSFLPPFPVIPNPYLPFRSVRLSSSCVPWRPGEDRQKRQNPSALNRAACSLLHWSRVLWNCVWMKERVPEDRVTVEVLTLTHTPVACDRRNPCLLSSASSAKSDGRCAPRRCSEENHSSNKISIKQTPARDGYTCLSSHHWKGRGKLITSSKPA